ncbi:SDR family oxidoreductase [Eubacterium barkeri]|uniref:dTDP-4-dehydrorhamnose reductase n=1 Tax=Eubacterium barkeri TaxID=1528 RepID=A0A1H3JLZ2_EUBBA|nr:sugar nucleotide-binding protein [Eubacterium barkeri]SDY40609.1 dTDP-4-dehydrorhamnose reductase [Eubacterium barkeri]
MSKKKIMLTGGKGFFCSRLVDFYRDKYDFLVTDKEELDITDEQAVYACVKSFQPEIIIHAGAVAVTDFCNKNPEIAHQINVDAAVYIANAAKDNHAKLIFLSSEQVFNGNTEGILFKEEDPAVPNTVYGENKLEAEQRLKEILDELWIVRFTWMFGMPERNKNLSNGILWETITKLMNQEKIVASKREFRGMTYVYEMIENFEKLFEFPYGTYHLGSQNALSRYDIVKGIIEKLGLGEHLDDLLEEDTEKYLNQNRDVRLNTDKATQLGMTWSTTKAALEKCIDEYRMC